MKSFKFRLQSVLEQRERRESLAKQTFAEAQAAVIRAERLLGEMREVRQALLEELCRRRAGAFDAFETRLYQDYMQVITQSLAEQEGYLRELATSCEAHKLHLVGTARDRQAQAHRQTALRAEQGVMDELATTRFNFQQRAQEGQ